MEAIQNILDLAEAKSPDEADEAQFRAHGAINNLYLQKLKEMELNIHRRLGVESQLSRVRVVNYGRADVGDEKRQDDSREDSHQ